MNFEYFEEKRMRKHMVLPGVVLYYVHGLGEASHITKVEITGTPYEKKYSNSGYTSVFCAAIFHHKFNSVDHPMNCEFSLQDSGVINNSYNDHLSFLDEDDAKEYLEWAKVNTKAPVDDVYMDLMW